MRTIKLVFLLPFFFFGCSEKKSAIYEINKVIEIILDDMTYHHPTGYFISPPNGVKFNDNKTIDRSKMLIGIHDNINDVGFYERLVKKIDKKTETLFGSFEKESFFLYDKDLEALNHALDMNLVFTNHDPKKSDFRYQLNGPESLFYFSNPRIVQLDKKLVVSVGVLFFCGKLCGDERIYFVEVSGDHYEVLSSQKLNPYEVK